MNASQCHHCGALLPGPVASCAYCGAPQQQPQLPAGCILLDDPSVTALLKRELTGVDSTFVAPSIPAKKINNARAVHAMHLPPNEQVLGLYDGTAFGSAKDGFIVTSKRICWKNQLENAQTLEWTQADMDNIYVDDNHLVIGRAKIDTLFSEDDDGLWAWESVLQTLARSANPEQARAETMPAPSDQPDPGWGGRKPRSKDNRSAPGEEWLRPSRRRQVPSRNTPATRRPPTSPRSNGSSRLPMSSATDAPWSMCTPPGS